MTSVESGVVMVDEEEVADAGFPSGKPSLSNTTSPSLFIPKPRQVSHCGQDQEILLTNRNRSSAAPGTPAVTAEDLRPMTPKATSLDGDLSASITCKGVTVTLRNSHMWNDFHGCRTEMILTKQGRRMFPYCSFSIAGLEPLKRYIMVMDILPMDNSLWKWNGREWEASGKAEPHVLDRVFIHPDSPCLGHCLTQSSVSFYKLKLTNNTQDTEGHIILHSMHRYLPRLHLLPAETNAATGGVDLNGPDVVTFTFPQTQFITVTSYQNLRITQLKINCNPFAKGFRKEGPFSQLSKPRADSSEPLLSLELNSSNSSSAKLRDLQKTLRLMFRPSEGLDKAVEQTVGSGAEFLNGVPSVLRKGSVIGGEKRPHPALCSESKCKLKVRRVDPGRRNGVYADKDTVDDVFLEARLKKHSCIGGEGMLATQEDDRVMADRPSPDWPTAPKARSTVSSECGDSGGPPALSLAPQKRPGSAAKAKSTVIPSKSQSTFPTSLSLSQKSSPDFRISLYPSSQSPAGPVLTPVSKPSSAGSDKGVSLHSQATPGGKVNVEAATPAQSLSGTTPLTSISTWKRKFRSKRKRSKCKKYVKKSSVGAQKVPEQPTEAAMLPDLEDVEGMLFVSFVSKEALGAHLQDLPLRAEEHVPPQEQTDPPKSIEVVETLEEKISRLQDVLLLDLQKLKHRQVIHTVLQEVGLKLSLLDPTLAIDLQYLGVSLPLPLPLFSPEDNKVNAGLTPSPEGAPFLSRTGKTKDLTKIKGWREKFVTSEISPLKLAGSPDAQPGAGADAGANADAGLRNRSAFCSEMLDEYLEREGPLMDKQAAGVSSPSSPPLVVYQLPTKSSSYIRPLHTVLSKQAPKPALPLRPLQRSAQPKPKPKHTFGPASVKAPALPDVKGLLPASYSVKAATKSPAAAKKALAPPPNPPAPKPRPLDAGAKPDYSTKAAAKSPMAAKKALEPPLSPPAPKPRPPEASTKPDYSAKAAAKSPAAAKKALDSPPNPPTPKPRPPEASTKPDYTTARRALAKVMLKLMDLEDRALWEGNRQTTITNERAELALTSLLTAQGTLKRSKGHAKLNPRWTPPCRQAFCRLGCVCASLAKGRRVVTHCRKPACMLGCSCLKHKMVLVRPSLTSPPEPDRGDLVGQKAPGEAFPSNSEPERSDLIGQKAPGEECPSNSEPEQGDLIKQEVTGAGCPSTCEPEQGDLVALEMMGDDSTSFRKRKRTKKKKKKRKRKRLSYAILEAETEAELEVELPVHLRRLWNGKAGEVEPEPLFIPTPVHFDPPLPSAELDVPKPDDFRVPKPAAIRTYVPRPNPVVRDEDKDPVYLYFESMMTCARVREYMSKPPPERPLCFCKSVLCSGKEDDPYHYSIHLTAEKRPSKAKARHPEAQQAQQAQGDPRRTLEILSDCDWESERAAVLAAVCQRAAQGDLSQPFRVGPFLVRPFGPALRREGDASCPVAHKVLISLPAEPSPERVAGEKSPPAADCREAPRRDRASKGLPFWSDVLPAGLLTAKKKPPGLPAKGLIEVNGKSYSKAKVQLGQMGALHMTSRLAAYLTGRWQPANQKKPVRAPPSSKLIGLSSRQSPTPLAGTVTLGSTVAALSARGPGLQPLVSPVAPMVLVPVEDPDSNSAAPPSAGSQLPLVPKEGVVLHPVHDPSGTRLFRHPSGRLVRLVPLDQLHPAALDLPDTGATSPSPTTPAPSPCPTETAAALAAVPAAPKPAPSFLGQRGTQTIRICPGAAGRVRSKGPAPPGFTLLRLPWGTPPQETPPRALQKEAEPPNTPIGTLFLFSPKSGARVDPGPELRPTAGTDGGGPGGSDERASNGERRSRAATPGPAETHQSRVSAGLGTSAQTAGSAQSGSKVSESRALLEDVSEDSEEDGAGMMSDAESDVQQEAHDVDVETIEELPEEKSTAAAQKKLTQAGLIRRADSRAERDTNPQARHLAMNGDRRDHNRSERRRRNQMTGHFNRLQDVLGMQSMSKISRVYILSQALEEIQTLVDECNHLEAKKRRMTQQREGYIKEIAQRSGTVTYLPKPLPPAYESASTDTQAQSPAPTTSPGFTEPVASARTPERPSQKCTTTGSEMMGGAQGGSGVSERRVLTGEDVSEDSEEDSAGETSDAESDEQQDSDAVEELPEENSSTQSMNAEAAQIKQTEAKLILQAELDTNFASRLNHIESERRRRNQMTDLFTHLQDILGIGSVSKISQVYVLSQAREEIQALEDRCRILEERKRSMTRTRAGYIKKIAQRYGKPEELISLKLQDICTKQKSLESKKRKAQQRATEPDRKQSPRAPAPGTDTFLLPKIVSVRSMATSPLLTTPLREQDVQAVFEAAQTAVSPVGSQSGDVLGDPLTPSSLQKEGACS